MFFSDGASLGDPNQVVSHPSPPESLARGRERDSEAHGGPYGLKTRQATATHPRFSPVGRGVGKPFIQRLEAKHWLKRVHSRWAAWSCHTGGWTWAVGGKIFKSLSYNISGSFDFSQHCLKVTFMVDKSFSLDVTPLETY